MNDRYVFSPHTSLESFVAHAVATPQGEYELNRMAHEFSSLADLLHHTQSFGHGTSTLVHMPDHTNIAVVNIPRHEFASGMTLIAEATGFPLT